MDTQNKRVEEIEELEAFAQAEDNLKKLFNRIWKKSIKLWEDKYWKDKHGKNLTTN